MTAYTVEKGDDTAATVSFEVSVKVNEGEENEETLTVGVTVTGTVADAETNGEFSASSVKIDPVTTNNGVLDFADSVTTSSTFEGCVIGEDDAVSTVPTSATLSVTGTAKLDSRTITIE